MHSPQPLGPTTASERIDALDILRGFALLGILVVNMGLFSFPFIAQITGTPRGEGALDRLAEFLIAWLATGKFYPLFSLLFGLGMTLQMERIQAAGGRPARFMVRRMLVLMVFGLIHALLIWNGDILFVYAIAGLLLLLFRNVPARNLLIWAGVLVAIPVVLGVGGGLLGLAMGGASAANAPGMREFNALLQDLERRTIETYARGTWGEIFVWRAVEWLIVMIFSAFGTWLHVLALFLVGMYFGKRQVFQQLEAHLPMFRRGVRIGLGVGLPASFALTWLARAGGGDFTSPLFGLWATLGLIVGPVLAFGYLSGLVLLTRRDSWRRWFAPLAAAGRMALSNYIMQSVVCTLIFYSFGLGLFGQVGAFAGLVLSIVIWLVHLPISVAWLSQFRFGPLEWLWRSLTYGRLQKLRKAAVHSPATS